MRPEGSVDLSLREITGYAEPEFQLMFMGEKVGHIMRHSSRSDGRPWGWIIQIGLPWPHSYNGYEISLDAAKAAFKAAWLQAFDAVTLEQFNAHLKANHESAERTRYWEERHGRLPARGNPANLASRNEEATHHARSADPTGSRI